MKRKYISSSILVLIVFAIDQISKILVLRNLSMGKTLRVIDNFFHLVYVENTGITFGLLRNLPDTLRGPFLIVLPILIMGFILYTFYKTAEPSLYLTLALILGGALGNIFDRVRLDYVVDFLYFNIYIMWWPAFNVADAAIVIGMIILSIHILRGKQLPI